MMPSSGHGAGRRSRDAAPMPALRLPASLDIEERLSAHAAEIQALHQAIRASAGGSSVRAWQMLPRHKRRRNASHNLLALPKRLRQKGKAEMRASNTAPLTRAEVRRRRGRTRGAASAPGMSSAKVQKGALLQQQRAAMGAYPRRREGKRRSLLVARAMLAALRGKTWLETHLWHAKRFRMSGRQGKVVSGAPVHPPERWGFSLPEESTMKSFRASWRDHKKHATLIDRSYDSWLRVSLSPAAAAAAAAASTAGKEPGDALFTDLFAIAGLNNVLLSCRFSNTLLSAPASYSEDGAAQSSFPQLASARAKCPVQVHCFRKGFRPARAELDQGSPAGGLEVLVRTHPASASQVERGLRRAMAIVANKNHAARGLFSISRLSSVPHPLFSAGSGAMGRRHGHASLARRSKQQDRSATLLERAIQSRWRRSEAFNVFELAGPTAGSLLAKVLRPVHAHPYKSFMEALRLGQIRSGESISLRVHDPRLSFPPRHSKPLPVLTAKAKKQRRQKESSGPTECELFASGGAPPSFASGEIQRRRSKLRTPGARLLPSSRDDTVPIVVLCDGAEGQQHTQSQPRTLTLTLIVPRGWGRAFWLSLVHPGTRVLGQIQQQALRFDVGLATFPYDWTGTAAFQRWEDAERSRAFAAWKRTPPAKRINPDASGVRWPFGGGGAWAEALQNGASLLSPKVKAPVVNSKACVPSSPQPWLFDSRRNTLMDDLRNAYGTWINDLALDPLSPMPFVLQTCRNALLSVKVTACRRGTFEMWDEVHYMPDDADAAAWRAALIDVQHDKYTREKLQRLEQRGLRKGSNNSSGSRRASHIGAITTGNFSLSSGKSTAIASVSLLAYIALTVRNENTSVADGHVGTNAATNTSGSSTCRNPVPTQSLALVRPVRGGGSVRAVSLAPVDLGR